MTILQTAKLNNLDPIAILQDILLPGHKNPFAMVLAPPAKENHINCSNKKNTLLSSIL
jgi:hypothetical protein